MPMVPVWVNFKRYSTCTLTLSVAVTRHERRDGKKEKGKKIPSIQNEQAQEPRDFGHALSESIS